ncbi:MAG TPA: ThuA domain-containing protein [Polyangiaceae bacterium]|nr:ThuA domain-containing protein [Polyangiaceae bacterium]
MLAVLALACSSQPAASSAGTSAGAGGMSGSGGASTSVAGASSDAGGGGSSGNLASSAGRGGGAGIEQGGTSNSGGTAGAGGAAGAGGSVAGAAGAAGNFPGGFKVLVFIGEHTPHSHDSRINDDYSHCQGDTGDVKGTSNCGSRFIEELGKLEGFATDVTFDPQVFTLENLTHYAAVIWVGNWNVVPIPESGRTAFQQYLESGGGSIAMHYSISMDPDWTFYRSALLGGATFVNHSGLDPAKVTLEDAQHPATRRLDASFMATSDYFQMSADPRPDVHVLASIDDATIKQTGHLDGSPQGSAKHPVLWSKDVGQGRGLYSTFGHDAGEYDLKQRPWMRPLIVGALRWVAHLEN